jgi:plasmid stabilization system protein ParE
MTFEVRFTEEAEADLVRLFDFLLDRATTSDDLDLAQRAIDEIRAATTGHLARTPFIFRKAGTSPFRRELLIPFGSSGYVALYEVEPQSERVIVLGVRHPLEDDYF